jgi:ComF family protein
MIEAMLQPILDFFFPQTSTRTDSLFAGCPVLLARDRLDATGAPSLDVLSAGRHYDDSADLRALIRKFKYGRIRTLAAEFVPVMAEAIDLIPCPQGAVLVPVPLHWTRRFARGFDQSLLLAQHLSRATHQPCRRILRRIRPTGHQAWRSGEERREAMQSAFRVAAETLPFHVILVDDVATTGATLEACARELKQAGVQRVSAVVIALG